MTHEEAKKALDQAREGYPVGEDIICLALWVTGDLRTHEELRSERVAEEVPDESPAARIRQRAIMVAASMR